jgi:hypothetical protein
MKLSAALICFLFLFGACKTPQQDAALSKVDEQNSVKPGDSIHFGGEVTKVEYPTGPVVCLEGLESFSLACLEKQLNIHIPCNRLRTEYFQYTEGEIVTIVYPDSSRISILCGTQADLSLSDKEASGRYQKKIVVKGYQLTYEDVSEARLPIFEKAFELLERDIK